MLRKLHHLRGLSLIVAAGAGGVAEARMLEADRLAVDQEERYSKETYNDKLSYRFLAEWDEVWETRDAGVRVSAGSLNVSRFDYVQDLKFRARPEADWSVSFVQSRREDTQEQRADEEWRVGWRFLRPWQVSLMGDGGALKEYGDVGLALGLSPDARRRAELFYWRVDNYYDAKKAYAEDWRDRQAASYGVDVDWTFGAMLRMRLRLEHDVPITWQIPSEGFDYRYARSTAQADVRVGDLARRYVRARTAVEHKNEAKSWTAGAAAGQFKTMQRTVGELEAGLVMVDGRGRDEVGVLFLKRDYGSSTNFDVPYEAFVEKPSPLHSQRREAAVYAQRHTPLGASPHHYGVWGLQANEVRIHEGECYCGTEVKVQTGWDYHYDEKSRLALNLTWDLDQLYDDYPYSEDAFKPWGGGNIQIMMVL